MPVAAQRWTAYRSAPFTVFTNGSEKDAQDALATLIQLRYTLSEKFGKDLQPVWPVAVVQRKNEAALTDVRLSRDSYLLTVPTGPLPRQVVRNITALLLRENAMTMDPAIEGGVATVFSTLAVSGPRVTLGAPPPPGERNLEWARMHLLLTDTRYSGTARVLLSNFAKGIDGDAAWKNTVGTLQREFDKQAQAHLAAGQFGTIALNGKPIDERRLRGEELEPPDAALLTADLAGTSAAYRAVVTKYPDLAPAKEGLGIALVAEGMKQEALPYLTGATSARALAALDTKDALEKAWRANPRWSLPHAMLARHEEKASDQAQRYRKAAELAPREVKLWRAAAQAFAQAELQVEAARMWLGAERAASSQQERDALREVRLAADRRRVDAEEAERRRIEEEKARELQRLKDEAISRIREAEARANGGVASRPVGERPPVEWFENPKGDARFTGRFLRVDCVGKGMLRLTVDANRFLIRDPSKILVVGETSPQLSCGPQKTVRTVTIEYVTKPDKALGTAGEVATLTYAAQE
jgi:hypothetical protein